jgi:alginate O-acetyltransferase complex protein AlgJ
MTSELHVTEAKSQQELAATVISPATAKFLSLAFVTLLLVPVVWQTATEISSGKLFREFAALNGFPTRQKLRAFDRDLDSASVLREFVQPRVQAILSSGGGFGNEKAVLGRDGWIYYAPGLSYVFGAAFLDPGFLHMRTKRMVDKEGETDPNPDPRPALFDLMDDCRRWGIHLVLVPIPDKAMLQPSQITARADSDTTVPDNPSFRLLLSQLRAGGADIFDPRPAGIHRGELRFLKQDTHWTPLYMEGCAAGLADHIAGLPVLPPRASQKRYVLQTENRSGYGDLVNMLKLPSRQAQFPVEAVLAHKVVDLITGQIAAPDPEAPVLLLGDSFTNIYSLGALNWGTGAGFGEHLAFNLNQPIDVIALNGAGATGIRSELVRAAQEGRLNRKKVLVYEFAIRDLAVENWRRIRLPRPAVQPPPPIAAENRPMPAAASSPKGQAAPNPSAEHTQPGASTSAEEKPQNSAPLIQGSAPPGLQVVAQVEAVSRIPEPGTAPYKDCVTILKFTVLTVERGEPGGKTILAAFWGMKNDSWTEAAQYKPGDTLRLSLIPFEKADPMARSVQRADDVQDYDSPLFWAAHAEVLKR